MYTNQRTFMQKLLEQYAVYSPLEEKEKNKIKISTVNAVYIDDLNFHFCLFVFFVLRLIQS